MRPLPYKHYFTVTDKKFVWEDTQMFDLKRSLLEGKRGYAIIEEVEERTTSSQLAYYFGGIIRQECMNSNCFAGWKEGEIHNHLLIEVTGTMRQIHRPDGSTSLVEMPEDFDAIMNSKKRMTEYISKVIAKLETEYQIYTKPSEHYKKTNKFRIKEKHYGKVNRAPTREDVSLTVEEHLIVELYSK